MALTHLIQRQVNDKLALGTALSDLLHCTRDNIIQYPIGGDVYDRGLRVFVNNLANLGNILAQKGFSPADGNPIGLFAHRFKDTLIFSYRELLSFFFTRLRII
jgi:hypothetical protein